MEPIKISQNVEFDVIYADGTRERAPEGVLFGVDNERIVFHNGTARPEVVIAAAEGAAEVIGNMHLPKSALSVIAQNIFRKLNGEGEKMENDVKGGQAVPKCPWCGALMADELRKTSEGWVAYCHCVICKARAPAVVSKTLEEHLIPAARMIVNCRFLRTGNQPTNGDKLREFANMTDDALAQRLLEIDGIAEEIPYCKKLPECKELADYIEPMMCLKCMIDWLGQPVEESEQDGE